MFSTFSYLKFKYFDIADPGHLNLNSGIYTSFVSIVGILLFLNLPLVQGVWILVSAVLLAFTFRGLTLTTRYLYLSLSSLATMLLVFLSTLIGVTLGWYTLFLFVLVYLTYQLQRKGLEAMLCAFMVLAMSFVAGCIPGDLQVAFHRFIGVVIGALVALVCALLLWPYRPRKVLLRLDALLTLHIHYYFNWVFTEFVCGNSYDRHLSSMRREIFSHLRQARTLLLCYPDQQVEARINLKSDIFGQIVVLARFLFEPEQQQNFTEVSAELNQFRYFLESMSVSRVVSEYTKTYQSLLVYAEKVKTEKQGNHDVQSICFIIERIAELMMQGKANGF